MAQISTISIAFGSAGSAAESLRVNAGVNNAGSGLTALGRPKSAAMLPSFRPVTAVPQSFHIQVASSGGAKVEKPALTPHHRTAPKLARGLSLASSASPSALPAIKQPRQPSGGAAPKTGRLVGVGSSSARDRDLDPADATTSSSHPPRPTTHARTPPRSATRKSAAALASSLEKAAAVLTGPHVLVPRLAMSQAASAPAAGTGSVSAVTSLMLLSSRSGASLSPPPPKVSARSDHGTLSSGRAVPLCGTADAVTDYTAPADASPTGSGFHDGIDGIVTDDTGDDGDEFERSIAAATATSAAILKASVRRAPISSQGGRVSSALVLPGHSHRGYSTAIGAEMSPCAPTLGAVGEHMHLRDPLSSGSALERVRSAARPAGGRASEGRTASCADSGGGRGEASMHATLDSRSQDLSHDAAHPAHPLLASTSASVLAATSARAPSTHPTIMLAAHALSTGAAPSNVLAAMLRHTTPDGSSYANSGVGFSRLLSSLSTDTLWTATTGNMAGLRCSSSARRVGHDSQGANNPHTAHEVAFDSASGRVENGARSTARPSSGIAGGSTSTGAGSSRRGSIRTTIPGALNHTDAHAAGGELNARTGSPAALLHLAIPQASRVRGPTPLLTLHTMPTAKAATVTSSIGASVSTGGAGGSTDTVSVRRRAQSAGVARGRTVTLMNTQTQLPLELHSARISPLGREPHSTRFPTSPPSLRPSLVGQDLVLPPPPHDRRLSHDTTARSQDVLRGAASQLVAEILNTSTRIDSPLRSTSSSGGGNHDGSASPSSAYFPPSSTGFRGTLMPNKRGAGFFARETVRALLRSASGTGSKLSGSGSTGTISIPTAHSTIGSDATQVGHAAKVRAGLTAGCPHVHFSATPIVDSSITGLVGDNTNASGFVNATTLSTDLLPVVQGEAAIQQFHAPTRANAGAIESLSTSGAERVEARSRPKSAGPRLQPSQRSALLSSANLSTATSNTSGNDVDPAAAASSDRSAGASGSSTNWPSSPGPSAVSPRPGSGQVSVGTLLRRLRPASGGNMNSYGGFGSSSARPETSQCQSEGQPENAPGSDNGATPSIDFWVKSAHLSEQPVRISVRTLRAQTRGGRPESGGTERLPSAYSMGVGGDPTSYSTIAGPSLPARAPGPVAVKATTLRVRPATASSSRRGDGDHVWHPYASSLVDSLLESGSSHARGTSGTHPPSKVGTTSIGGVDETGAASATVLGLPGGGVIPLSVNSNEGHIVLAALRARTAAGYALNGTAATGSRFNLPGVAAGHNYKEGSQPTGGARASGGSSTETHPGPPRNIGIGKGNHVVDMSGAGHDAVVAPPLVGPSRLSFRYDDMHGWDTLGDASGRSTGVSLDSLATTARERPYLGSPNTSLFAYGRGESDGLGGGDDEMRLASPHMSGSLARVMAVASGATADIQVSGGSHLNRGARAVSARGRPRTATQRR